jgi:hypothetical protein
MGDLISAILSTVEPESWDAMGGPGSIEALGGTLIVKNHATAHEQIDTMLESLREVGAIHRNVTIEAYWLQLTADQLQSLTQAQTSGLVNAEALKSIVATPSLQYQGQITCLNGQTVYAVSGDRHMVITSAIPVVGSEVAYQPRQEIPNAGVLLQTTALVLPGGKDVLVDVQSTVTEWRDVPPRRLQDMELDCPVIAARQLATAIQMQLGTLRLIGGLTVIEKQNAAPGSGPAVPTQLYLVLKVDSPNTAE